MCAYWGVVMLVIHLFTVIGDQMELRRSAIVPCVLTLHAVTVVPWEVNKIFATFTLGYKLAVPWGCCIFSDSVFRFLESTAVEQVVACPLVTQRARVRSPVGTSFLGEVYFRGFSSPVRRMSGSFRPTRSPNIIWPSLSSIFISLRAPMTWDVDAPLNPDIHVDSW